VASSPDARQRACLAASPDGRQSATALAVARGTTRLLHQSGFSAVSELALPSGRRADLVALNAASEIWIVEIKSSIEDFRADGKWMDYRRIATGCSSPPRSDVPCEIFPKDTGLIVADAFGARIVCEAAGARPACRDAKSMSSPSRAAPRRLAALADPAGPFAAEF